MHINTSVLRSTYSPGMQIKRVQTPGVGTRLPSQTCAKTVGSETCDHPPLPGSLDLFCEKDDEGGPSFFPLCISHGARMLSN